jgi:hypothetical protein
MKRKKKKNSITSEKTLNEKLKKNQFKKNKKNLTPVSMLN